MHTYIHIHTHTHILKVQIWTKSFSAWCEGVVERVDQHKVCLSLSLYIYIYVYIYIYT